MLEHIKIIDGNILLWIQEHIRNPYLTPFMKRISMLGNAGMIWVLIVLILLLWKSKREVGILVLTSILINVVINNFFLKNIVARTRPYERIPEIKLLLHKAVDYSFPSGHSSCSFAAAVVMFLCLPRRWGIPALILATLIALSRLYVGIHYPTDVAFGIMSGSLIGYMVGGYGKNKFLQKGHMA